MKIRYILCLFMSWFFIILTGFYVEASDRQLVTLPSSVVSQGQCKQVSKYNHYPYEEVSTSFLKPVGNGQMLHQDAAKAFLDMRQAAQIDGINLTPLSGFRSRNQQKYLFYEVAKQRGQTLEQRAKVSAPPGYSQHHTGLAIDVNSLDPSFASTKAFTWLQNNAKNFNFSLSFKENNSQDVSFEPWHWAWHGSEDARLALHDDGCI
ncbi:MAG: D-alanyl-D-alanine carboxypeptidase family protein [Stigonema ocellatum SAG 48.90 = DSM 106950]|nr:D-alanyl-D-alanine carboxypeptidase family protein [Stigonema ocellatum SAG 48.90 = DSM 106950]